MFTRRVFLAAACTVSLTLIGQAGENDAVTVPELLTPVPLPQQAPAREGWAKVSGARLWYWDTGGDGTVVVLVHPATGSGLIWGYQQPDFAKAGYRVIGYSRKNYAKSEATEEVAAGSDADDLHNFVKFLGIRKFHAVGSAAGGGIVMRYAVTHPEMLLSMTIACSLGSIDDQQYLRASASLRPSAFGSLPASFRELGPCYRAGNPEGVREWEALEQKSRSGGRIAISNGRRVTVTWEILRSAKIPTLLLGGDADLYTPPPLLHYFHDHLPGSEMVIIHGAGHSAYWEQPAAFNRSVLGFIGKHSNVN